MKSTRIRAIIILLLVGPQKNLKYFQVKMSFPYPNEKKFKNIMRSNVEIVIPLAKSNISLLKPLQIKNFKTFLWTH